MSQIDLISIGFARGVQVYSDYDPSQKHSRIMIYVRFGNLPTATAMLDTGAPWCILKPQDADDLNIKYRATSQPDEMIIRGVRYSGWLCDQIPVTIEAHRGEELIVLATVFIPELEPTQGWDLPNFIGLSGFLERIRFAVDPFNNEFYFGTDEST